MKRKLILAWAVLWRSGGEKYLLCDDSPLPLMFPNRRAAREAVWKRYSYIAHRSDLRAAPFFWRMPQVVRIRVMVEMVKEGG